MVLWYNGAVDQHCLEDTEAMSRKPKPPMMIEPEGLSAADGTRKRIEHDDFTGEPIEVVETVVRVHQNVTRKQWRESKLQRQREFVKRYVEQRDKALAILLQQREAKLAQAQPHGIALGKDLVIIIPRKPFRRF